MQADLAGRDFAGQRGTGAVPLAAPSSNNLTPSLSGSTA